MKKITILLTLLCVPLHAEYRGPITADITAGAAGVADLLSLWYEKAAHKKRAALAQEPADLYHFHRVAAMRARQRYWARIAALTAGGTGAAYELTSEHNHREGAIGKTEKALGSLAHLSSAGAQAHAFTGKNIKTRALISILRLATMLARNRLPRRADNAAAITGLSGLQRLLQLVQTHLATTDSNSKLRTAAYALQVANLLPLARRPVAVDDVAYHSFNHDGSLQRGGPLWHAPTGATKDAVTKDLAAHRARYQQLADDRFSDQLEQQALNNATDALTQWHDAHLSDWKKAEAARAAEKAAEEARRREEEERRRQKEELAKKEARRRKQQQEEADRLYAERLQEKEDIASRHKRPLHLRIDSYGNGPDKHLLNGTAATKYTPTLLQSWVDQDPNNRQHLTSFDAINQYAKAFAATTGVPPNFLPDGKQTKVTIERQQVVRTTASGNCGWICVLAADKLMQGQHPTVIHADVTLLRNEIRGQQTTSDLEMNQDDIARLRDRYQRNIYVLDLVGYTGGISRTPGTGYQLDGSLIARMGQMYRTPAYDGSPPIFLLYSPGHYDLLDPTEQHGANTHSIGHGPLKGFGSNRHGLGPVSNIPKEYKA